MDRMLLMFAAGLLGGAMNALAGGGSFVTLPAMIAIGVPSVQANASSTTALLPGGFAGAWAFREGLGPVCGVGLRPTLAVTVAGGLAGAVLLLRTPASAFDLVLPWLLLLASLTLAFGARLRAHLHARVRIGPATVLGTQFVLGVYGGYFGGAVGIMMMAAWTLFGQHEIKAMNAPRTLLVSSANTVAVLTFILAGAVYWAETIAMLAGATLGGWGGAMLSRRAPVRLVRAATLLLTTAITLRFFVRAYAGI
jgi:uncharacterized protein